ncbi:hypothetical protein [Sphingomonas sp.]|uniref:hypothetical protein n=1 Tax=Sphingomonas sp. TaxID=28214 RepID=UPI002EDB5BBC
MDADPANAAQGDRFAAFFDLLALVSDPQGAQRLETMGARFDRSFEAAGQLRFTLPGRAGEGSELLFAPGKPGRIEGLKLVPPAELHVTRREIEARFGAGQRAPALPNQGWRVTHQDGGRRVLVVYAGNPELPTSHVVAITALPGG